MITTRNLRAGAGLAALAATGLAQAHSGHGHTEAHDLLHVLEAEHVVPLLLALAAAVLVLRAIRRRGKRRPTRDDR
jgi:hypothetical protein